MTSVMNRRTFLAGTSAVLLFMPRTVDAHPERKRPRVALLLCGIGSSGPGV